MGMLSERKKDELNVTYNIGRRRKRNSSPVRCLARIGMVGIYCAIIILAACASPTTEGFSVVPGPLLSRIQPQPLFGLSKTGRSIHHRIILWRSSSNLQADSPSNSNGHNGKSKRPKNKKQRIKGQQQKSVDDLVSKIGLATVPKPKHESQPNQHNDKESRQTLPSMQAQLEYARNGHTVLRNYVDASKLEPIRQELLHYGKKHELKAWRQKVEVAAGSEVLSKNGCKTLEDCKDELERLGIASDQLPFLQYFNTWRTLPCVHEMALELAETAAVLLDVSAVRLYQDSFFWKRADDGPTPWHTDARMAPFDTPSLVTLWIPLHDISRQGSALHFVSKSHADFALPFWNPYQLNSSSSASGSTASGTNPWDHLEERYQHNQIVHYMPLTIGDLTVHSGWTLHCADSQNDNVEDTSSSPPSDRLALAISYVDARAPVRENVLMDGDHGDDEDQWSYADWVKEVPAGQEFEHPLVPIVWPESE